MSNIKDRDVFIVGAVRTPIGRGYATGALHDVMPVELLALTLKELAKRTNVPVDQIEDVICGVVSPVREQGANIPRFAAAMAGFPNTVPAVQINRMCGSSQQAIHFASQAVGSGDCDLVIAAGVEMMSVVSMGSDWEPTEEFFKKMPYKVLHQGVSADMIAKKWKMTKEQLNKFSGASHEKAAEATKKGIYQKEIMPVLVKKADGKEVLVDKDEGIRVPVDYEKMGKLSTPFDKANGLITAANASQISDGAAAVMICSGKKLKELGLKPLARIITCVTVGDDPEYMLTGPIPATAKALKRANLTIDQIDLVEINEAFASVVLAWMHETKANPKIVNPNGGAIAMGHPLGASGAVLMTKMVHDLQRNPNKRYALQTMCIGFGMATATIIENCSHPSAKL